MHLALKGKTWLYTASVLFNRRKLAFFVVELCCWNKRPQNTSGIFAESQILHRVTVGVLGGEAWFLSQHSPLFLNVCLPHPHPGTHWDKNKEVSATQRSLELLLVSPASSYTEQQSSSTSPFITAVKLHSCYPNQRSTNMLRVRIYLKCRTCSPFRYTIMVHLTRKKIKLIKFNHWNHF